VTLLLLLLSEITLPPPTEAAEETLAPPIEDCKASSPPVLLIVGMGEVLRFAINVTPLADRWLDRLVDLAGETPFFPRCL
jgi:hypothetical protein